MTFRQQLMEAISAHLEEFGLKETTFGKYAVNDGKLVERLREGRPVGIDVAEKVLAFIETDRAKRTAKRVPTEDSAA